MISERHKSIDGFTGLILEFWGNGLPAEQRAFVRGRSNGPLKIWYSTGVIAIEGWCNNGKRDLEWHFYNAAGIKIVTETYVRGDLKSTLRHAVPTPNKEGEKMLVVPISPEHAPVKVTTVDLKSLLVDKPDKEKKKAFEPKKKKGEPVFKKGDKLKVVIKDADKGVKLKDLMEHVKKDPEFLDSSEVANSVWEAGAFGYWDGGDWQGHAND